MRTSFCVVMAFVCGCGLKERLAGEQDAAPVATATASMTATAAPTVAPAPTPTETAPSTTPRASPPSNAKTAAPVPMPPDAGSACENIAGTWATGGACGPDVCVITQTGCTTNFKCSDGNASYAGTINGRTVNYAGLTATGKKGSCTGTINGTSITGTCQSGGAPCAFTAKKR
jgi:hypothetical protein